MKKVSKGRFIVSSALIILLIGSKFKMDKDIDSLNNKIIQWGTTVEDNDIHFIAHRGYSSAHPDNSLEAIQACSELKCVEGIECDVHLTKDDELVLIHNDLIGLRHIYEYTYDDLRQMDDLKERLGVRQLLFKKYNYKEYELLAQREKAREKSSFTLTTLDEILKTRDKSKILFIDVKFSGYHDNYLMTRIGELVQGEENIIIQSFNKEKLREMKELYPDHIYQLLIDSKRELESIDYEFDAYGIKYTILGEDTIKDLRNHNKIVSLWTVNSYQDFSTLYGEYSDYQDDIYYISDNPDMIGYQFKKDK
jgi:glycerophosphoryl diester phosphodiesterase